MGELSFKHSPGTKRWQSSENITRLRWETLLDSVILALWACVCECVCVCARVCVRCVYVHASWQLNCKGGAQGYRKNQTPQTDSFYSCSSLTRCQHIFVPVSLRFAHSSRLPSRFPLPTSRTQRVRNQWFSLQASMCHTNLCHLLELSLLTVKSFSFWIVVFINM